jgi:hypothetical protein
MTYECKYYTKKAKMGDVKTETAMEKLENLFGKEILSRIVCDNTSRLTREPSSSLLKIDQPRVIKETGEELDLKKRQKLDEYANIEMKQAKLLVILANNIYRKLNDDNNNGQRFIDADDFQKVFYPVVELEKLAILVHEPVSNEILKRIEAAEWPQKPHAGDILTKYYHYYKIYKCVLERYPSCQVTLSIWLKKKNFAAQLKKVLDTEAEQVENVRRLDMLLDRVVDFPRRCIQLYESYLKLLEPTSKEFEDIKKVYTLFTEIFEFSNDALNKMNNFQLCYELQYMFDPPLMNIVDQNRQLIKQGPLFKVAKRNGELLLRHLALVRLILLI